MADLVLSRREGISRQSVCREAQRNVQEGLTPTSDACDCLKPTIRVPQKQVYRLKRARANFALWSDAMVLCAVALVITPAAEAWADFFSSSQTQIQQIFVERNSFPEAIKGLVHWFSLRSPHPSISTL